MTTALVDCGETENFIDPTLIHQLLLPSQPINLSKPWMLMEPQIDKDRLLLRLMSTV